MMKKALSVLLAGALVWGMAVTAFAASGKITGMSGALSDRDYTDIEVEPGAVYKIPLTADMFDWSGDAGASDEGVSSSQINNGKVTVKVSYAKSKSKDIIKDITLKTGSSFSGIKNKTAYVQVEFIEDYNKTDDVDFDFTVYLAIGSKKQNDYGVQFEGTFGRPVEEIDEDEDYVDLSEGIMVEPSSYIRSVEAYLGEGVTITASMSKGKKYYGTAERGILNEDEKIANAYPEIATALTLTTNMTDGKVRLEVGDDYYVYNADGKYVGTSDEELKYSSKYYLAEEKINLSKSNSSSTADKKDDDDDDDDGETVTVKEDEKSSSSVPIEGNNNNNYTNNGSGAINDNPNTGGEDNPNTGAVTILPIVALAGASAVTIFCLRGKKQR